MGVPQFGGYVELEVLRIFYSAVSQPDTKGTTLLEGLFQ